ncbi:aminotransferase class I/II-fold pyridoxal phosphate-dependent enzyme [Aeoliella mucimassa]|nr:aminotransferase class I/II-fold pyridoxal phosphate-dependent enzyme [Aeoliella mucimassa]
MSLPTVPNAATKPHFTLPSWGSGRPLVDCTVAKQRRSLEDTALDFSATNLVDLLRSRAATYNDRIAFSYSVDGEQNFLRITYAELDQRARAIASRLQRAGLSGGRALMLYPSGLDFIAAFFGCLYAGVTAVPAYPPRRNRNADRIERVVRDAKACIVLSTTDALARMEHTIDTSAELRRLPWWSTDNIPAAEANGWREISPDKSDLAFLQYTSGSTGDPKGVMLTHDNLLGNAAVISQGFGTTENDVAVFWLPLYHDMGLIGGVIKPVYGGSPCTLMSPAHFLQQPLRWLKMISATGATVSGGPNFAYDLCVDRVSDEQAAQLDLSRWNLAFNGAELVRAETLQRFAEKFSIAGFRSEAFYPCYGLAEATLLVAGADRSTPPRTRTVDTVALQAGMLTEPDPCCDASQMQTMVDCGRSLLDQEVRIVDPESGVECPRGKIGEIWVAGRSVSSGYWQRPELNQEIFGNQLPGAERPFLRTGDLGVTDGAGLLVIGRRKDLIIIRGVNYYPQDIEEAARAVDSELSTSPTAAFAVESGAGEQLIVLQELPRRLKDRADEIAAAISRQVLELHDIAPTDVVMVQANSLPKTSSGKLQRFACRDAYLNGNLKVMISTKQSLGIADDQEACESQCGCCDSCEQSTSDQVMKSVLSVIVDVAKDRAKRLTPSTNLIELGLDSLERMEIVAALEDQFGTRFPEETLLDMHTPSDIVRAIGVQMAGKTQQGERREVELGDYDFAESPEYRQLQRTLALADNVGLQNPYFTIHQGVTNDRTMINGRQMVNFCSYNYLGMSGDPLVVAAAQNATARYGTSVSASRLVSGEKPLHGQLESAIANFLGAEAAITMVGGHATNETTIGHLFGPGDLILHDALSHNSIVQGCKLSGAHRRAFPHSDPLACRDLLARYRHEYRRVLIVIEGVYSMDGDIAPLPEFVELKEEFKAYLMVDEAHSLGTIGPGGHGIASHYDIDAKRIDILMGTMSKSLGSCGGYIAARREIVEYLKYTAPGFVYSVGLPPANTAAALASLRQIELQPERVVRLQENSALFLSLANEAGLDTGASRGTPVVPVITGSSESALRLSDRLFRSGINVQPILYPAVEDHAARLRFFITSDHTPEQIREAVSLTAKHSQELGCGNSAA